MEGDGEGDDSVEEIFSEVRTAHVREFMGQNGIQFSGVEFGKEVRREQERVPVHAYGCRAGNGGGAGKLDCLRLKREGLLQTGCAVRGFA